jgi:hypothetical protein
MVSTARDVPNPILQQATGKPNPNQQSNGKQPDAETPAQEAEPASTAAAAVVAVAIAATTSPPKSLYQLSSQLWSPAASLAAAVGLL